LSDKAAFTRHKWLINPRHASMADSGGTFAVGRGLLSHRFKNPLGLQTI
jgi:hypothetical protein